MSNFSQNPILFSIYQQIQNHKLSSSELINQELSKVIALLLRDYISNWYANLSPDQELYQELVLAISLAVQELERRFSRVDWVGLLSQDLPNVLANHIRDHRSCCKKMGTAYAGGKGFEELFYGVQPHIGLQNDDSERDYLRRVSEIILDAILPESEMQSDAVRMLIREIFCNNVLLMLTDVLADPEWLNETILREVDAPQSEGSRYDYLSDASELSNYTDDAFSPSHEKSPSGTSPNSLAKEQDVTLFQLSKSSKPSFLRRRRENHGMSPFTQSLNKITFGGLERVTSGLDKIKEFVIPSDAVPKKHRKHPGKEHDTPTASESDADDFLLSPASNGFYSPNETAVPALQVEDFDTGSQTPLQSASIKRKEREFGRRTSPLPSGVSFAETEMEMATKPSSLSVSLLRLWETMQNTMAAIWDLHRETIKGPWKLGPINTTLYERSRLEESIMELVAEIFEFNYRQNWIYTQLNYFLKPVLLAVGGHVINRAILRMVYFVIGEESVTTYLENFRNSFWPNNQPAPPFVVRSESEKAHIRRKLEQNILALVAGNLNHIIKEQAAGERILYLIDVFQTKRTNKHLLFILIDLIMVHLIPESASLRANFE
ncbi:hypothetical protein HDU91_007428 [Kappamyces sp. JEL0680]|nr:hypothetical protein HDU91_007428 [Kappamyces sp. JEL0680]